MISFFRKIRKNFLNRNKFSSYLLYAGGEVLLIVIGILIALAINNWNQHRIIRQKEHFYLEGLKGEFERSKIKLQNLIAINRTNYSESKKILAYINTEQKPVNEEELSRLLFTSFSNEIAYNPNNSVLNELINSGRLEDISNAELRMYLTNWESMIQSIHRQENTLRQERERMLAIFRTREGSIRTILEHTQVLKQMDISQRQPLQSNLAIVRSPDFENNLLTFILTGILTETNHYQPLLEEVNTILAIIEKETN